MGDIDKQLKELQELSKMEFLDDETRVEIDGILKTWDGINEEGDYNFNNKLEIKFINKSPNRNPEYATQGSAGFDFRANITEPMEIPGCNSGDNIKIIPTGLYFELPEGLELQVRPRSGLAAKHGITVLNSPGTVDSDYRGSVGIILINHKQETFTINPGDRIAQGVISSHVTPKFADLVEVKELNETERGEGKFGSTGIK